MDPRVKTSTKDLQLQHDLSYECYKEEEKSIVASKQMSGILQQLNGFPGIKDNELKTEFKALESYLKHLMSPGAMSFSTITGPLGGLVGQMQGADLAPTEQCKALVKSTGKQFDKLWNEWTIVKDHIDAINKKLKKEGLATIRLK
jgi:hypothetical protein